MLSVKGLLMRARSRFRPPDPSDHVEYNRAGWDSYAARWSPRGEGDTLGDEWAPPEEGVADIIEDWVWPHVTPESTAAEIGVGGGRIARLVAPKVRELWCFDISSMMLKQAQRALRDQPNVRFGHLKEPRLPAELTGALDFIYSFDVFVHIDLHTMWKYVQEVSRVLKPGGRAFLHTANLTAPDGWERFASQDHYHLDGHYFITPEIFRTLVGHTDLTILRESSPDASNSVLNRDYLILLEKPGAS